MWSKEQREKAECLVLRQWGTCVKNEATGMWPMQVVANIEKKGEPKDPDHIKFRNVLMALLELDLLDPEDPCVLRDVSVDGYRLQTWDTYEQCKNGPQSRLAYRFTGKDGLVLFQGDDFGCSPMAAIDSDDCLRSLLGFLTLRPGDTDDEYFDSYTPSQLKWAEECAEELSLWAMEDPEDKEGLEFKDWTP